MTDPDRIRTAYLFPGQGSQRPGMGADLVEGHPHLRERYYRVADEVLGLPLSKICWEGDAETLRRTEITQPAIFLTSMVLLDLLGDCPPPDLVAGHSLGEYSALVCAGALEWTDALRLVRRRGELMAAVNETTPGAMTAVLGLGADVLVELCAQVTADAAGSAPAGGAALVEVANDNDPTQVVVSGTAPEVAELAARARAAGASRTVPLDVGAPFHCSLMREVEAAFAEELAAVTVRDPRIPVVANVTGQPVTDAAAVTAALRAQLAGAVRWTSTLATLGEAGVTRFVEVGPARVLTGFCRTVFPDAQALPTGDARRLRQARTALGAPPSVTATPLTTNSTEEVG